MAFSFLAIACLPKPIQAEGRADGAHSEACQVAMLRNGFSLRYVRQESAGEVTRLWVCEDSGAGYVEVPTGQIEEFQAAQHAIEVSAKVPGKRPDSAQAADPIVNLIANAASRYRIDPDFVSSVVKAESGYNPGAVSSKGAGGLMQLMPRTAASLGIGDVFDAAANVEGGTKYLRQLLDLYSGDAVKALAAYNAGPGRVEQYAGVPPYRETRAYITRIIDDYNRRKTQQASAAASPDDQ